MEEGNEYVLCLDKKFLKSFGKIVMWRFHLLTEC